MSKESHLMHRVAHMYLRAGYSYMGPPRALNYQKKSDRIAMMQEELDEFSTAQTIVEQYDGLIDLIVFAVGTLEQMGLPLKPGFDAVMDANDRKKTGVKDSRGIQDDLVKPADWVGPEKDLKKIIDHFMSPAQDIDLSELAKPGTTGAAMKWDDDKTPIQLVPSEFVYEIADIFAYGAEKYAPNNWRQGGGYPSTSRVMGSIFRHLFAFNYGEDKDPESGKSHLAHAATQLCILLYYIQYGMNEDDRYELDSQPEYTDKRDV